MPATPVSDPLSFLAVHGVLLADYPTLYYDAIAQLSDGALVAGFYARPRAKVSIFEGAHGSKLVRPPHERLVAKSDSMPLHFVAATAISSGVQPEFSERAPVDLVAAVRQCVRCGTGVAEWRAAQEATLSRLESSLRPFAEFISSLMVGSSAAIASHVNLPFMTALVVALQWPDIQCVRRWFYGHAIVGDIPDTGLFRPQEIGFRAPPSTLDPPSNRVWNARLEASLRAAGRRAESDAEARAVLEGVERATAKELRAGVVHGPYTRAALDRKWGDDIYRAQRRFGVEQGVDDSGASNIRAIDNSAANSGNDCGHTYETIAPPSFAFVVLCG